MNGAAQSPMVGAESGGARVCRNRLGRMYLLVAFMWLGGGAALSGAVFGNEAWGGYGGTSLSASDHGRGIIERVFDPWRRYSHRLLLVYPSEWTGEPLYSAEIRVVKVDPHVALHFFKQDGDAFMYLNHGQDQGGLRYYYGAIFPVYGIKAYVTATEIPGPTLPPHRLDEQARHVLMIQLQSIDDHGGVEAYVEMLERRGYFPPTY